MKKYLVALSSIAFLCYGVFPTPFDSLLAGSGSALAQGQYNSRTGMNPHRINQLKDLKVAIIKANGHKIKVWLMDNESKREEGMMFLKPSEVHSDEGMLFVFPDLQPGDSKHGFWMHNCPCGLDICYVGPNKKVLNVADGQPYNDTPLKAAGDYQWVLEMKTNCAKKLGIKHGTLLQIPSSIKGSY